MFLAGGGRKLAYLPGEAAKVVQRRKQRSDRLNVDQSVFDWVMAHARCQPAKPGRPEVVYLIPCEKEVLYRSYCIHHQIQKEGREAIFHPEGGQNPEGISKGVFFDRWPKRTDGTPLVVKEPWYECVCQECYEIDLLLEAVLDRLKALHPKAASNPPQAKRQLLGLRQACSDESCPWNNSDFGYPEATFRVSQHCLQQREAADHNLPFLLCSECNCLSSGRLGAPSNLPSSCPLRDGRGECNRCGISRLPNCSTLTQTNPHVTCSFNRNREGFSPQLVPITLPWNDLCETFGEKLQKWIPHQLLDRHQKIAREKALARCRNDPGFGVLFIDWSEKCCLLPTFSATAGRYPKLGVLVGVFVYCVEGRMEARTFVGIVDEIDEDLKNAKINFDGPVRTSLFIIKVLKKCVSLFPALISAAIFSDGGYFCLLPALLLLWLFLGSFLPSNVI
jgi:hypothetical protein